MKLNSLKHFLSEYWLAIVVAIAVSLVAGLPQIIVRNTLGSADQGIPFLVNDSEGEYLGRVHEILDGHWSVSSPVLYEYKDSVSLIPPTGEFIFYALPVMLTRLPLNTIVFLSKFIYPALLFLFVYLFIFSLLNKKDIGAKFMAMTGGLLVTVGYDLDNYRGILSTIIHGSTDTSGLLWNRLVNPITGGILLFAFLWLFSRIVKQKSNWPTIIVSGLILSVMSGYIFSFVLSLTIAVLMGLYFIWKRDWRMTWRTYIPVVIAIVINGIYLLNILLAMTGGIALSDPRKSGMFFTHVPLINLVSLAALVVVVLCFILFFKKDTASELEKRWWFLSLAIVIACELVFNQQIITGITIWPQHFTQYTKILVMAIVVVFLHNIIRSWSKNLWRAITVILFIIIVLFGWRGFQAAAQNTLPKYTELQSFAGVFDYLNTYASKDCVVYVSPACPSEINRFIPALTSCNDYHSFYIYSGVPDDRVMYNYLINLKLRGIKLTGVKNHFFSEDNIYFVTKSYFFRDWNDIFCCRDAWLTKIGNKKEIDQWYISLEKDIEKKYTEFLKGDLYTQLTKYRVDYFVVDTQQQPQVNSKNFSFLSLKGQFNQFAIYSVIKPK